MTTIDRNQIPVLALALAAVAAPTSIAGFVAGATLSAVIGSACTFFTLTLLLTEMVLMRLTLNRDWTSIAIAVFAIVASPAYVYLTTTTAWMSPC